MFGTSPKNGRDDNSFPFGKKNVITLQKAEPSKQTIALILGFPKQRKSHFNNKEPTLNFVFHANRQCNTELPYR